MPVPPEPEGLLRAIRRAALLAFTLGRQRDYARVDFRLTPDQELVFLEVNANPQLRLGANSIAVAAGQVGLSTAAVFRMILDDERPPQGAGS